MLVTLGAQVRATMAAYSLVATLCCMLQNTLTVVSLSVPSTSNSCRSIDFFLMHHTYLPHHHQLQAFRSAGLTSLLEHPQLMQMLLGRLGPAGGRRRRGGGGEGGAGGSSDEEGGTGGSEDEGEEEGAGVPPCRVA